MLGRPGDSGTSDVDKALPLTDAVARRDAAERGKGGWLAALAGCGAIAAASGASTVVVAALLPAHAPAPCALPNAAALAPCPVVRTSGEADDSISAPPASYGNVVYDDVGEDVRLPYLKAPTARPPTAEDVAIRPPPVPPADCAASGFAAVRRTTWGT